MNLAPGLPCLRLYLPPPEHPLEAAPLFREEPVNEGIDLFQPLKFLPGRQGAVPADLLFSYMITIALAGFRHRGPPSPLF